MAVVQETPPGAATYSRSALSKATKKSLAFFLFDEFFTNSTNDGDGIARARYNFIASHARKYRDLLEGFADWSVDKSTTPPSSSMTNANIRITQILMIVFFMKCWENKSRPSHTRQA